MKTKRMGIELMILQAYPGGDGTSPVRQLSILPYERVEYEMRPGDPPFMSVEKWMGMNVKATQFRQRRAQAMKMLRGE